MFRNHTCNSCGGGASPPNSINTGKINVACIMPPMNNTIAPCDVCCCTEMSLVHHETGEMRSSSYGGECPNGYVPVDVYLAKNDPRYSPLFGCYEYTEIASVLDAYLCFHICGCGGQRSVLLAAAHFVQLHTEINPATLIGWMKMASKPTAVMSPLPDAILKSKHGDRHWNLTTYGMEYQEIRKPAIALAGLAWGI
jgi:hypothetical protein